MNYLKNTFILLFTFFALLGCQNIKPDIKYTHKIAIDKWNGLASYAKSNLNDYPIYLAASFSLDLNNNKKTVSIGNFQITNNVNATQIDLLNPTFENKVICDPTCHHLVEYMVENKKLANSLLSDFFGNYEFELFKFYSRLFILNDKVMEMKAVNNTYLSRYITSMTKKKNKFYTLNELADFLQTSFTVNKYKAFINNPKNLILTTNIDNKETNRWSTSSPQEIALWASNDNSLPSPPKEAELWGNEELSIIDSVALNVKENIEIGDTICTSYNSIGTVIKIDGKTITIDEVAIVKISKDGLLSTPPDNFLQLKSSKNKITFLSIVNQEVLSISNVFPCSIQ